MSSVRACALTLSLGATLLIGCAPASADLVEEDLTAGDSAALGEATIRFAGDWSERVVGELRAGAEVHLDYDPARLPVCRGEQGGRPQWAVTAHWRLAGTDGSTHDGSVAVAGNMNGAPTIELPVAGDLEIWFQSTNRWGCVGWDSSFGDNYRFEVDPPAGTPGWVGNAASVIARQTCNAGPCEASRVPLSQGFRFDTWARQRAAIAHLYFDVWEEGVTDRDDVEVWREVDARVHVRFDGQEASTMRWADFHRRVGNDARFELALRQIDPFFAMPSQVPAEQCPDVTLSTSEDGFYVRTSVEITFEADGVPLAADGGGSFVGVFEDYAQPYAACL